jgi:hypothetical protein
VFKNDREEDDFIRQGVYGGRTGPRVTYIDNQKYNYVDVKGMYASAMIDYEFPIGKKKWMTEKEREDLLNDL